MKTTAELLKEVEAELNAVKSADMGLQAVRAFAQHAQDTFKSGDVLATKEAIDNILNLVEGLIHAVPANVTPASAGPVGKSPHEQYLEQARAVVEGSLGKMQEALVEVQATLGKVHEATSHGVIAISALNSPDLKNKAA